MKITVKEKNSEHEYPLLNPNLINIYNMVTSITLLREMGIDAEKISESLKKHNIDVTRYSETDVGDKKIVVHLAKGQNPIACSRSIENAKDYPGNKIVYFVLDDYYDATKSVENTSWFYDTDFEFLNDDSIFKIIVTGSRHWDLYVRLLIADVPDEKILHSRSEVEPAENIDLDGIDVVFMLYDVFNLEVTSQIKEKLTERINTSGQEAKDED